MKSIGKIYHSQVNLDIFYHGEVRVLTYIANYTDEHPNKEVLPSDISKALSMTNPRVSSILNNLEKKGYVKREFSTLDRRKVYIHITKEGTSYIASISLKTKGLFDSIVNKVGEDDARELVRILQKVSS
jgi:DNA-binding MarR family transcriptional regulator